MLDQIGDLHGECATLHFVGKTSENGDSVGQIFKNGFQEIHRSRQSSPCTRGDSPSKEPA